MSAGFVAGWIDRGVLWCSLVCAAKAGHPQAAPLPYEKYTTEEFGALCLGCDEPYPGFDGPQV